jgi:hypothetical protein
MKFTTWEEKDVTVVYPAQASREESGRGFVKLKPSSLVGLVAGKRCSAA